MNILKRELPGSKLFVVDGLAPEDLAMIQALYSRSAESVEVHLEKVLQTGSGKFMSRYYLGYNHKSIADCGSTTMFIEGVSMLTAKAVQDWPLYSGQETSTRFIDMSKQRIADPVGSERSRELLDAWMHFYMGSQERVEKLVRIRYPRRKEDSESVARRMFQKPLDQLSDSDLEAVEAAAKTAYDGAVKARVFDSLRGFLPSGITTQLSWHTNLRQASDHLGWLTRHPSLEIKGIGLTLASMLSEQYKSSVDVGKQAGVSAVTGGDEAREAWEQKIADEHTYHAIPGVGAEPTFIRSTLANLTRYEDVLSTRPRGSVLPHFFTDLGQLSFAFPLDFGSFRDIQRHRNGVCRMPLLTTDMGFEPWYLEQLDEELRASAEALIKFLTSAIKTISDDPVVRQYYIPMGFRIPCQVTYALPAALYVLELRSGKTIHPTLRRAVQWMCGVFRNEFPQIALHADTDPDDWTVRRGQQTIVAK
jgi:thymidylate synthase ThyX